VDGRGRRQRRTAHLGASTSGGAAAAALVDGVPVGQRAPRGVIALEADRAPAALWVDGVSGRERNAALAAVLFAEEAGPTGLVD